MSGFGLVLSGGGARGAYEVGVLSYVFGDMVRSHRRTPDGAHTNHQTMAVLLPPGTTPETRAAFIASMRTHDVEVGALSYALDTLESVGVPTPSMPIARDLVARGVSIPLFPTMTEREQDQVLSAIEACS